MDSMQEVDDVSKNQEWRACEKNLKKCEKVHESWRVKVYTLYHLIIHCQARGQ
jgi:hypothetical protein